MTRASDITIIACWIFFVVYWTVSARGLKKVAERETLLAGLMYRVPMSLGGILLLFQGLPFPLGLVLTPHGRPVRILAAVLCLCGLFLAIWARRTLAGNWSSDVTFKRNHELIQVGPYRLARHPIYTGLLLMALGTALAGGQLRSWLGWLLLFGGTCVKLKQEEMLLLRHFPDTYPAYQKRVKALIPFIL